MRVRTVPTCLLLCALLLGVGCAAAPAGSPGARGRDSGTSATAAGGTAQPAAPAAAAPAGTPAGEGGGAAPDTSGSALAAGAGAAAGPGMTSDERRAAIDQRLSDSLGSFDARLRTEQQRVAQERDARLAAAAGSAASEERDGAKSGDAAGSAATEGPGDAERGGRRGGLGKPRDHSGDLKTEKAGNKPDDNAGNGATKQEIPDGSDDDVVARRLRQAAEQETDPELKEKLWKEYIDYKKNAQTK
jgi:hypothetical protein